MLDITRLNTKDAGFTAQFEAWVTKNRSAEDGVRDRVEEILNAVRERGDEAVLEFTQRYDQLTARQLKDLEIPKERFGYVTVQKTIRYIRFEEILYSRRKCLNEIAVYDKEIRYTAPKIKKLDEILYGFKIQGCIQPYNPHEDSNRQNLAICMDRFWARVLRP